MTFRLLAAVIVATAIPGFAHVVPIPPSVCAFDPLALDVPAAGASGAAAVAGTADRLRTVYDVQTNTATFCPADAANPEGKCATAAAPRTFTIGALSGTLTFPTTFVADALAGGDFTVRDLALEITVGATSMSVPVMLTTGLAEGGGLLAEGARIGAFGRYTLVGVATPTGLPAPLDQPIQLSLTCQATPAPDVDQFALPPSMNRVSGTITAKKARLKIVVDLQPGQAADFVTHPALFRLHAADTGIAEVAFPTGLAGAGRRFHAVTDDGQASLAVRVRSASRYVLTAVLSPATVPATTGRQALVEVTQDVGGYLSHGERLMRANRAGTRLHAD